MSKEQIEKIRSTYQLTMNQSVFDGSSMKAEFKEIIDLSDLALKGLLHDEMLAALKSLVNAADNFEVDGTFFGTFHANEINAAYDAIDKAEGK